MQEKRNKALNSFRHKNCRVMVCTDVAGRGIDIPNVDIVINFDVPDAATSYVHRVGRTARAGAHGEAITLVSQYELNEYAKIETTLGTEEQPKKFDKYEDITKDIMLRYEDRALEAWAACQADMKNSKDLEFIFKKNSKRKK